MSRARTRSPLNPSHRQGCDRPCGVYACSRPCRSCLVRRDANVALHGAAVAALVPAFVWLAPDFALGSPRAARCVLLALAVIADFNEVPLRNGMRFDAGLPLALITLAVARAAAPRCSSTSSRSRSAACVAARTHRAARQPGQPRGLRLGDGRRRDAARRRRRRPGSASTRCRGSLLAGRRDVRRQRLRSAPRSTCRCISATRSPRFPRMFVGTLPAALRDDACSPTLTIVLRRPARRRRARASSR